jgi:hypothetical protein
VVDNPHPNSKVNENGRRYNNKAESSHSMGLADRAMHDLLPTVQTQGLKVCDENGKTQFIDLSLLPTPTAIEGVKWTNTWNPNSQMGQSLSAMAGSGMLPTPTTRDWKGETNPGVVKTGSGCIYGDTLPDTVMREARKEPAENAGKTSRLSPLFTEEMMGFPLMWTALPFLSESGAPKPSKPTETPSSHK